MGIYDRDYYREEQPGLSVRGPRSIVVTLILINVVVFIIDAMTPATMMRVDPDTGKQIVVARWLSEHMAVEVGTITKPWLWWQFLTYGFAHDPSSIRHVFFNMLQLWFLGRMVEQIYGRAEFLSLYLVMLVVGSVVWAISTAFFESGSVALLGASGAVSGVVILFILNFPRQTLILFPIPIPVKAWVIGVLLVVVNLVGAIGELGNTAFGVHLTGIAFAFLYFRNRWNLGLLGRRLFSGARFKPRPRLRVHDPAAEDVNAELNKEVDRILEKISRQGESSLSRKERRTLESASREFQKRRRVGE